MKNSIVTNTATGESRWFNNNSDKHLAEHLQDNVTRPSNENRYSGFNAWLTDAAIAENFLIRGRTDGTEYGGGYLKAVKERATKAEVETEVVYSNSISRPVLLVPSKR